MQCFFLPGDRLRLGNSGLTAISPDVVIPNTFLLHLDGLRHIVIDILANILLLLVYQGWHPCDQTLLEVSILLVVL